MFHLKSIEKLIKEDDLGDWINLPVPEGLLDLKYSRAYIDVKRATNLFISIVNPNRKEFAKKQIIHITLSPLRTLKEMSDEEWIEQHDSISEEVFKRFFPNREFIATDDQNQGHRHYFHILADEEWN